MPTYVTQPICTAQSVFIHFPISDFLYQSVIFIISFLLTDYVQLCQLVFVLTVGLCKAEVFISHSYQKSHTHTHTHTNAYTYIYIYIYMIFGWGSVVKGMQLLRSVISLSQKNQLTNHLTISFPGFLEPFSLG